MVNAGATKAYASLGKSVRATAAAARAVQHARQDIFAMVLMVSVCHAL